MNYFVVACAPAAPTENQAITNSIRALAEASKQVGWWHHIENVWLVTDISDRTAQSWQSYLKTFTKGTLLVAEVRPVDWSAYVSKAAADWLHSEWDPTTNRLK